MYDVCCMCDISPEESLLPFVRALEPCTLWPFALGPCLPGTAEPVPTKSLSASLLGDTPAPQLQGCLVPSSAPLMGIPSHPDRGFLLVCGGLCYPVA